MPDFFLCAAGLLLLIPIVALLRFTGCAELVGLDDLHYRPGVTELTITFPPPDIIGPGETRQFRAHPKDHPDQIVDSTNWTLGPNDVGSFPNGSNGLYVAPDAITKRTEITVYVTGTVHDTGNAGAGQQTVVLDVVNPEVAIFRANVDVNNQTLTLHPGDSVTYSAKTNWDPNAPVAWKVMHGTQDLSRPGTSNQYKLTVPSAGATSVTIHASAIYGDLGIPQGADTSVRIEPDQTAASQKPDTTTAGSWPTKFKTPSYRLANAPQDIVSATPPPPFVDNFGNPIHATQDGNAPNDARGLVDPRGGGLGPVNHLEASWHGAVFSVTLDFGNDLDVHRVVIYCMDWNTVNGRSQRAEVFRTSGTPLELAAPLDTQVLNTFSNGVYLAWNITGKVRLQITNLPPSPDAVVNGIFFG